MMHSYAPKSAAPAAAASGDDGEARRDPSDAGGRSGSPGEAGGSVEVDRDGSTPWCTTPVRSAHDAAQFAKVLEDSFAFISADTTGRRWIERTSHHTLVAELPSSGAGGGGDTGAIVGGGGAIVNMGIFLGGRKVSLRGISTVAVAPHVRGLGAGRALMKRVVREAHKSGAALCALNPTSVQFYRGAGFERAAFVYAHKLTANECVIDKAAPTLRARVAGDGASGGDGAGAGAEASRASQPRCVLRPISVFNDTDLAAVKALYGALAPSMNGYLDRQDDYTWDRVFFENIRGADKREDLKRCLSYGVFESTARDASDDAAARGRMVGYLFVNMQRAGRDFDLRVSDVWSETRLGWDAIIKFLASHNKLSSSITVTAPQSSPLLQALAFEAPGLVSTARSATVFRVLDVVAALEQRGYGAGPSTSLTFTVVDSLLPSNDGTFTITVAPPDDDEEGGEAVAAGGVDTWPNVAHVVKLLDEGLDGTVGVDFTVTCGGLAPLLTGAQTCLELVSCGLLRLEAGGLGGGSTAAAAARVDRVFTLPQPTMLDFF